MNVLPLDTYKLVQKLKGAGFSEEQAGAVTDAPREAREFDLSELATKADIRALQGDVRALEAATKADIRTLEATMAARIAEAQRVMVQWAVGLFLAQLACIGGLIKFLH